MAHALEVLMEEFNTIENVLRDEGDGRMTMCYIPNFSTSIFGFWWLGVPIKSCRKENGRQGSVMGTSVRSAPVMDLSVFREDTSHKINKLINYNNISVTFFYFIDISDICANMVGNICAG